MPGPDDKRLLPWAIIASQFAPPFMFSGVAVALPSMGAELGAGATSLGLVETLFLAGQLTFFLPIGRLADATDKRTLYKLGLVGFGLTSVLVGLLSSMPAILVIRFVQGATSAVLSATGPAILAELVGPERRGRVFGASIGAIYAGLSLGPISAGILIDLFDWRAVFFGGAAVLLAGSMLIHALLASKWRRPSSPVHLPSAALLIAAVLCLVAGSALVRTGVIGYAAFAAGIGLSSLFVFSQRRLDHPLLRVDRLMANRPLRRALGVQWLLYVNAFASIFMISLYLQVTRGQTAQTAGQIIAVSSILMAVTAPIAGALSDRWSPTRVSAVGISFVLTSALMARTFGAETSLWFVASTVALQGLGFAFFSSPNMTTIMNSVDSTGTSMAAALGAKSRSLGMVTGMLVTGVLVSLTIGNEAIADHPEALVGILETAYTILAGLVGAALLISFRR